MKRTKTTEKGIFRLMIMIGFLLLTLAGRTQQPARVKITGIIVSQNTLRPVAGANITVKGTQNITSSDDSGHFSLNAKAGQVLQVSSVGFAAKELKVTEQDDLRIVLTEDFSGMQDVVVVGYGKMKKLDLSSAQVSVSAEAIGKTVNTTVEQALQGRAAGVYVTQNSGQPGGGLSVTIRGISTLNGSTQPLYVIDGVQSQQNSDITTGVTSSVSQNPLLAGLNPADIESINVLQGPSATAIYGSRGTNGVVLITTKRGKSGQTKIGYNYLYSLQDKPDFLPTMNLQEYAQMENAIRRLQNSGAGRPEFADSSILGPGTNWQDALFKTSPLQKHQLTLSGGNSNTTYYLSGEYFTQEGVALGSRFDRYSVRLNLDNQTRKWLKLSTNLNFNQTNEKVGTSSENLISSAIATAPNIAVKNQDGSWGGADASNGNSVQNTPLNPVAIASLFQNNLKRYNGVGGVAADVTILKGLIFRTSLNGNISWTDGKYYIPSYQIGDVTSSMANLGLYNYTDTYWNLNELLQYTTKIRQHDIDLMVSHEAQESHSSGLSGSRSGFVSNDVVSLPLGNALGMTNNSYKSSWAMESYLARLNYSYAEKYILQAAIRADGSVNFAPENRWGYFPSVSAAWRISEEPFLKSASWIDELKLRLETGLTGNQGSGQGYYAPLSSVATSLGTGFTVAKFANEAVKWESTTTYNAGLNWNIFQNRIQLEGDYYIKKTSNLLMQLPEPGYMGTSGTAAIQAPTVNIGGLENKGWAITLNTVNIDNKGGFMWRSNFNISHFKTTITKFYQPTAIIDRQPWYMSLIQRSVVGQEPWLFYGYVDEGLFQSVKEINTSAVPTKSDGVTRMDTDPGGVWVGDIKYKDLNGDGIIDYRDQTFIGNPWPRYTFGFTNTFSYKNFDLSILLTGTQGNDVYNYVRNANTNPNNVYTGRNLFKETFNYAKPTGNDASAVLSNPNATIPRITNGDPNGNGSRVTTLYIEDGSYVKVKNVTLSYNVPQPWLERQHVVSGARLSVGVQNLLTFTKYKGYDPEIGAYVGQSVNPTDQLYGVDAGRYPLTRVYTANLSVDF